MTDAGSHPESKTLILVIFSEMLPDGDPLIRDGKKFIIIFFYKKKYVLNPQKS